MDRSARRDAGADRSDCRGMIRAAAVLVVLLAPASPRAAEIPLDQRQPDTAFVSADTRALQNDDTANPGMLSVLDGEALWNEKAGPSNRSCADCHGDAATSMKGVAARYPVCDPKQNKPLDLEQRINLSRVNDQKAPALVFESKELLALAMYVGMQSRGMPVAIEENAQNRPFIEAGRALFEQRQGQLELSCAQCHDDNWGKKLAGSPIPQAHPTGYPIYRLEWQEAGSLQRRLRGCMSAVRAEPYDYGSPEMVDLEFFMMWRSRGMPVETPAVRP